MTIDIQDGFFQQPGLMNIAVQGRLYLFIAAIKQIYIIRNQAYCIVVFACRQIIKAVLLCKLAACKTTFCLVKIFGRWL